MKYLFIYDYDNNFETEEHSNFRDALIEFMKYTGSYEELFQKASSNFNDNDFAFLIQLYNKFGTYYSINKIYELKRIIFEDGFEGE